MARLEAIAATREQCTNRRLGHNTWLTRSCDGFALKYHRTDVVTVREWYDLTPTEQYVRLVTVRTGGWRTVTTLQRIRHALQEVGLELWTHDIKGEWRVVHRRWGQAFTLRDSVLKLRQVDGGEWVRVG